MIAEQDNAPDFLAEAVARLAETNTEPFFVQIGGFDGVSFDPLRQQIVSRNLRGLIVEPIPQYFEQLQSLYAGSPRVTCVNCAITEASGERPIWRFDPSAVEKGILPPHFAGISSFLMEDLLKETGVLGRSSPNPETTAALRSLLQPVMVKCCTMSELLTAHGVAQVDILQIDTEGYDFILLKLFDFTTYRPAIVHYEHQHLSLADRQAAETLLASYGYQLHRNAYDTLATLDVAEGAFTARVKTLRDLASSLHNEGRGAAALSLLEHLAATGGDDAQTLRLLTRAYASAGQTLAAIETLTKLAACELDSQALLAEVQAQFPAAIVKFNGHAAKNEVAAAERYAAALATLVPGNAALQEAALNCNLALGRAAKAAKFARTLAAIDPNHVNARATLAEACKSAGDNDAEIEHRKALALSSANPLHPLVRLRDLHDVASTILCGSLDERRIAQLDELLGAARAIVVDEPADSEWAGWAKHYHLAVQALDIPQVLAPTPRAPEDEDLRFVTARGETLTGGQARAYAKRLGAKTIFFAAADRAYVDLYARWYVKSILKFCDVPFLIVVHVVGGAHDLPEIAASLAIADERLLLTGDHFDAGAVTTKCYDTPPKGLIAKPVAHLQSVRFLRAETILDTFGLPLFISDIDLILQRGVSDLLAAHANTDLVLNENVLSPSAGSRLTANLLLLQPAEATHTLLRFLRTYLTRALGGAEVSRWIDQFALLLARHHLLWHAPQARIGYFDTDTDINNVMFPSYREHPFRFLSLYHGFDTSSLETNPNVLGETAGEPVPRRSGGRLD